MNQQNVQPVQQANVGLQPSMPAPQEPGFMQTDPADITFSIDENSGQLIMVPRSTPASTPSVPDVNVNTDIRFQSAVEDAQTQHIAEPNPLADRLEKMEGLMGQMGMLLQGLLSGEKLSNLSQQQPQEQEDNLDLNELDGAGLVKLITSAVDKAISTRMAPMQQTQSEILVRQQFNDAAYRYGQDFITLTPAMVELKKSDPNVSWDQAYSVIKMGVDLVNKKKSTTLDSTIQTNNGSNNGARQPQLAQTLINKANGLSTEANGTPRMVVNEEQKIQTVSSAFDKAWSDLMGG